MNSVNRGQVTALQPYQSPPTKAGKVYTLNNVTVGSEVYSGVYKVEQGIQVGSEVEVLQGTNSFGKPEFNIKLVGAATTTAPTQTTAAAAPASTGFRGNNNDTQERISRNAAINTAIEFVKLGIESGAITKTAAKNVDLLNQLVGKQAQLFNTAFVDKAAFDKLPHFDGNINEGMNADPLPQSEPDFE